MGTCYQLTISKSFVTLMITRKWYLGNVSDHWGYFIHSSHYPGQQIICELLMMVWFNMSYYFWSDQDNHHKSFLVHLSMSLWKVLQHFCCHEVWLGFAIAKSSALVSPCNDQMCVYVTWFGCGLLNLVLDEGRALVGSKRPGFGPKSLL